MRPEKEIFDVAYDAMKTEFRRLVRERVNQQAKAMVALGRSSQFQKSATPYVGRNKIYEETLEKVGNDYVNALRNILFPNCGVVTDMQTSMLVKELTKIIETMMENAKRGTAQFAASIGLTTNLGSFNAPLENMYRSAASRFGDRIVSEVKQSNLKKTHGKATLASSMVAQSDHEKVRIFFSHSTKDKKRVQAVADFFENTWFEVFVAHRDISVSSLWRGEILKHLKACDVFVSFLTTNFHKSDWTDQEAGIAIGESKAAIIGLQFSKKPYGFLEQYQCINCRNVSPRDIAESIIEAVLKKNPDDQKTRRAFIESLIESKFFDQSIMFSNLLSEIKNFSNEEFKKIIAGAGKNDQISNSPRTVKNISTIIEQHKKQLPEQLIADYENKVALLDLPKR